MPFTMHDAAILVAEADAFNTELYGHADATPMQPEEFDVAHNGIFLIAYLLGDPAGCGGYRRSPEAREQTTVEFKRLYVRPSARRSGVARSILAGLEKHARAAGYRRAILDVGGKQRAAHALYEAMGFQRIRGFSVYRDHPGNRAYGKEL